MQDYKLISKKGEGTFSEVLKAQSQKTGNYVAIKCMKAHFENAEQVSQLREIQALKKLSPHPNIIKLLEVLYDEPTGRLALVFELMEMNIYELIKDRKSYLPQNKIREIAYQLFKAIEHMHRKGVFHRDIKPENVLLLGDTIKLADLGSCRGTYSSHPYTEYISTRWYRPPECLMTDGYYDHRMDVWGAGCVLYEIITLVPLFPGENEVDMVHRIHKVLGTPHQKVLDRFKKHSTNMDFNFPARAGTGIEKLLGHAPRECVDLLQKLLTYDPEERITAEQVLKHEYFRELWEADRQKDFRSSLTSIRLSPRIKHGTHQSVGPERAALTLMPSDRSLPTEQDRTLPYMSTHGSTPRKFKAKKPSKESKFATSTLSLKAEGIFKVGLSMNQNESPYIEQDFKKNTSLPPIKSMIQANNTYQNHQMSGFLPAKMIGMNKRPNEAMKRAGNNIILKPNLSNQSVLKKAKKNIVSSYWSSDYAIVGKKAN